MERCVLRNSWLNRHGSWSGLRAWVVTAVLVAACCGWSAAATPSVTIQNITPASPISASQLTVTATATGSPTGCTLTLTSYSQNSAPYASAINSFPLTTSIPLAGVAPGYYAVEVYCPVSSGSPPGDMKTVYIGGSPSATGISPQSVQVSTGAGPGGQVTVSGNYFGTQQLGGYIKLTGAGMPTYFIPNVVSWSNTAITFTVPETVFPGSYQVVVVAAGVDGPVTTTANSALLAVTPAIQGFVDLHTHPLANLGFGGKLIYGAVDDKGAMFTLDGSCKYIPTASETDALGHEYAVRGPTFPIVLNNACGDDIRYQIEPTIEKNQQDAVEEDFQRLQTFGFQGKESQGVQDFPTWPQWNDLLNQKMYYKWIQRSQMGGQRVLVALAVNSQLLGDMTRGPGDLPDDDLNSGNLQIKEAMSFISRHSDFLALATQSSDILTNTQNGKLSVVLGVELDNIGGITEKQCPMSMSSSSAGYQTCLTNFESAINALMALNVRYFFPVHLVDNPLGGTAAYTSLFDLANEYEEGQAYSLSCSQPSDQISFLYAPPLSTWDQVEAGSKLGTNVPGNPSPVACAQPQQGSVGNVNTQGLTTLGKAVFVYLMGQHALIDIDHMSQLSVADALKLAQSSSPLPYAYPLFSGHNGIRQPSPALPDTPAGATSERNFQPATYTTLGKIHGMAGIGSSDITALDWFTMYNQVMSAMGPGAAGAFGTDTDGMALSSKQNPGSHVSYPFQDAQLPASVSLGVSTEGNQKWNYNSTGVAHYGMLPDFLEDVDSINGAAVNGAEVNGSVMTGAQVVANMNLGAQYFYETWRMIEGSAPAASTPPAPAALPGPGQCPGAQVLNFSGNTGNTSETGLPCVCPATSTFMVAGKANAGSCQCPSGESWYQGKCAEVSTTPTPPGITPTGGGGGGSCPSYCTYGCNSSNQCKGATYSTHVPD